MALNQKGEFNADAVISLAKSSEKGGFSWSKGRRANTSKYSEI